MAKANAARAADFDDDDGKPRRSQAPAGSKPPPATTGASSVFALGAKAKPVAPARKVIDVAAIKIISGVPVPPLKSAKVPLRPMPCCCSA